MSRTISGTRVRSRPVAYFLGGTYRNPDTGGFAWVPNIGRRVSRYYDQRWGDAGYSLRGFVSLRMKKR